MALYVAHQAAEQKAREVAEAKAQEALHTAAVAGARRDQAAARQDVRLAPPSSGDDDPEPRGEARRKLPRKHASPSTDETSDEPEEGVLSGTLAEELAQKLGLGADGAARVRAVVADRHRRAAAAEQPRAGAASSGGGLPPNTAEGAPEAERMEVQPSAAEAGLPAASAGEHAQADGGQHAAGLAEAVQGEEGLAAGARVRSRSPRI